MLILSINPAVMNPCCMFFTEQALVAISDNVEMKLIFDFILLGGR